MADHINIQHPKTRDVDSDFYQQRLIIRKLKAELELLQQFYNAIHNDLDAIFTRIERGDVCELHYPDGRMLVIRGFENAVEE